MEVAAAAGVDGFRDVALRHMQDGRKAVYPEPLAVDGAVLLHHFQDVRKEQGALPVGLAIGGFRLFPRLLFDGRFPVLMCYEHTQLFLTVKKLPVPLEKQLVVAPQVQEKITQCQQHYEHDYTYRDDDYQAPTFLNLLQREFPHLVIGLLYLAQHIHVLHLAESGVLVHLLLFIEV